MSGKLIGHNTSLYDLKLNSLLRNSYDLLACLISIRKFLDAGKSSVLRFSIMFNLQIIKQAQTYVSSKRIKDSV